MDMVFLVCLFGWRGEMEGEGGSGGVGFSRSLQLLRFFECRRREALEKNS